MGYEDAIEGLKKAIEQKQKELEDLQGALIQLSNLANVPVPESTTPISTRSKPEIKTFVATRGDEYYGRALATVIAEILDTRNKKGMGPATIRELYDEMKNGGYRFDAKDDDLAMRGITISMRKNVVKFHKLPSGKFGLTEWYPDLKEKKEEVVVPTKKTKSKKRGKLKNKKQSEQSVVKEEEPKE